MALTLLLSMASLRALTSASYVCAYGVPQWANKHTKAQVITAKAFLYYTLPGITQVSEPNQHSAQPFQGQSDLLPGLPRCAER